MEGIAFSPEVTPTNAATPNVCAKLCDEISIGHNAARFADGPFPRRKKDMTRAVIFHSQERCSAFQSEFSGRGVEVCLLDFDKHDWLDFDFASADLLVYYPSFEYSSNHPLALRKVYDNLAFLHQEHPHLLIYPDPAIISYYNDKYRQFLFLKKHDYPILKTLPLFSAASLQLAEEELGYPMVVKNRYGAGGGAVFKVNNRKELEGYYRLATMDLWSAAFFKHLFNMASKRIFFYHLIKTRKAPYPFLSPPLLAQEFKTIDRDLKTVVGDGQVVEGHWRLQASNAMWKMNIDDGGIGQWSHIPQEALELSLRLAQDLGASWINLDLMLCNGKFFISEFSPVWHHYRYKEKPSFVYKDDYNLTMPLETSLNLEKILVDSLLQRLGNKPTPSTE